jgi:hypothetical protein
MTILKYGKKPARIGAVKMRFGAFFDSRKLPVPPRRFGHYSIGQPWGMLANDKYSNCIFAGAAHETMVWKHEAGIIVPFRDQDVLADYAAVTGFDPEKPETDQGGDMQAAASYRRKIGIIDAHGVRHKIDAYNALRPGYERDLALAVYLTGAAGVGLMLPPSAEAQFAAGEVWDVVPGETGKDGHYVPCVGRNSAGDYLVATWERLHAMTPDFYAAYCDEATVYISFDALDAKGLTPEGYAADQLRASVAAIAA